VGKDETAPTQLANPDLKWEKTKQLNVGTDFAVLNDRVAVTIDVYNKKTEDLLVNRPIPRTTGFTTIATNIGSMENKGVELGLTSHWLQSKSNGLSFSSTLTVARNRNKVLELFNNQPVNSNFASRYDVGKPFGFFYGHIMEGIFQSADQICSDPTGVQCKAQGKHAYQVWSTSNPRLSTAPGDVMFKDIRGRDAAGKVVDVPDGIINADDRDQIGDPWPDYEGGLTNTIAYKMVDVSAFLQFSQGNDIYNPMRYYMDRYGSDGDNHTTRALQRWTPTNPSNTEPRAIWGDPNQNTRPSSRFVEDGSYVRLKNLTVGFKLPTTIAQKGGFRNARLYVTGTNIWTKTDYSGFDPEVNYQGESSSATRGTDFYTIPQQRVWTFGVNVNF
jgi:TonB-dependent starch-binding outer membrane protein SusC